MPRETSTPITSRRKLRAGIDQRARNLAVLQNALLAVNILQEKIQRHHALGEAAVDLFPFRMRQDARDQIEREQALGAAAVAINRKRNALNQKREVGELAALLELRGRHGGKLLEQLGVLRARVAGRREHLVVKAPRLVTLEQARVHHVRRSCSHLAWDCTQLISAR